MAKRGRGIEHDVFGFGPLPEGYQGAITDIITSPDGDVWIATPFGVATYNGAAWTAFDVAAMGLPDEAAEHLFITSMTFDAAGTLWVAAGSHGLYTYTWAAGWARISALDAYPLSGVAAVAAHPQRGVWVGFKAAWERPPRARLFRRGNVARLPRRRPPRCGSWPSRPTGTSGRPGPRRSRLGRRYTGLTAKRGRLAPFASARSVETSPT